MVAESTVHQLRDNQAPEAPGVEFSPWRYCLELSQAGIAKQIGGAYATLITIAFHANKQAHAWPSIPTLAREVGCTERGIMRDIKALEKYGALVIKKKPVDRGGVCNLYIVVPVIALLVKRPVTMRERLKVHGPDDVVTPDNIVRGDNPVASPPDNIVTHPLTGSSPKRSSERYIPNNPSPRRGASAPASQVDPLNMDMQEALAAYAELTGQKVDGKTVKQCRACVSEYGKDDTIAVLRFLWDLADGDGSHFWRRGTLSFAAVAKRVTPYRDGELTPRSRRQVGQQGPASTLTATATEMRESMHGIAFCPECDRVLPNHKQACSKAAGAQGGAA